MTCSALVISGPTGPTGAGAPGPTGPAGPASPTPIIYGGTVNSTAGVDQPITFPAAFPNALDGIVVSGVDGPNPNAFVFAASASGFTLPGTATGKVSWLAFGH